MSEDGTGADDADSGSSTARTITLLIIGLVLIAAVIAIVSLVGDGADDEPADSAATTQAPVTEPAATEPPATEPPDTEPPDTEPPATEPPATEPPDTDPPATEPPATEPPDTEPPATEPPDTDPAPADFSISIRGIEDGGEIPRRFTCDGADQSPVVTIEGVPSDALQMAFLTEDPDAPTRTFVHWVAYAMAPDLGEFTDGLSDVTYGLNDVQLLDWFGPCPPEGDGPHGYTFTLFALSEELALDPGLDGRQLRQQIEPVTIAEASIVATYER